MIEVQLTLETEAYLDAESSVCGCSKAEFAAKLIEASVCHPLQPDAFSINTHSDARAWIFTQNLHLRDTAHPATDLRALAHEDHPW